MKPGTTRRTFVQSIAALPAMGAAVTRAEPAGDVLTSLKAYGMSPGMIHLNTASAGPTPNRVLTRTVDAWRKLGSDPVAQSYYELPDTVFTAADSLRRNAASLIGCTPDEILFTRGTTDGMTTLAHSVRLQEGDHV